MITKIVLIYKMITKMSIIYLIIIVLFQTEITSRNLTIVSILPRLYMNTLDMLNSLIEWLVLSFV